MAKDIQIFAVEDDFIQQENLQITIEELGYELVGLVDKAEHVLPQIARSQADIILLDIQLAGKQDGIALGQEIQEKLGLPFIYMTAFQDQETFQRAQLTQPHAYLLKPINNFSLQSSIESAYQHMLAEQAAQPTNWATDVYFNSCFFTKIGNKLVKIMPEEVLWVAVSGNHYCEVVTAERRAHVRASLSEMNKKLQAFPFVRVHRSYLVNAVYIESINEADQTIQLAGSEIPIGKSFREGLMKFIQKL